MSSNLHINGPVTRFYNFIRLSDVTIDNKTTPTEHGLTAYCINNGTYDDTAVLSVEDGKSNFAWKFLVHTITADTNITVTRGDESGIVQLSGPDIRPGEGVSIGNGIDASTGKPYMTISTTGGSETDFNVGYGLQFVKNYVDKGTLVATHRLYTAPITSADLDASGRCWIPDVYIANANDFWLTAVYTQNGQQTYPDIYLSSVQVTIVNNTTTPPTTTYTTKHIICVDFKSVANFNTMSGNGTLYCKVFVDNAAPVVSVQPTNTKPSSGTIIDDETYT